MLDSLYYKAQGCECLYLHAADDHAGHNLTGVTHNGVLSSVHVKGGHAWHSSHHAEPLQPLHACHTTEGPLFSTPPNLPL